MIYHDYTKEELKYQHNKPYVVIVNAETDQRAWYDRKYRLCSEDVSAELLAYAQKNATQVDREFAIRDEKQLPSWMRSEYKSKCVSYWTYNDATPIKERKKIPET